MSIYVEDSRLKELQDLQRQITRADFFPWNVLEDVFSLKKDDYNIVLVMDFGPIENAVSALKWFFKKVQKRPLGKQKDYKTFFEKKAGTLLYSLPREQKSFEALSSGIKDRPLQSQQQFLLRTHQKCLSLLLAFKGLSQIAEKSHGISTTVIGMNPRRGIDMDKLHKDMDKFCASFRDEFASGSVEYTTLPYMKTHGIIIPVVWMLQQRKKVWNFALDAVGDLFAQQLRSCRHCSKTEDVKLQACKGCRSARYCCVEHQKADWKANHKYLCAMEKVCAHQLLTQTAILE